MVVCLFYIVLHGSAVTLMIGQVYNRFFLMHSPAITSDIVKICDSDGYNSVSILNVVHVFLKESH
jgi:hypothetical protein